MLDGSHPICERPNRSKSFPNEEGFLPAQQPSDLIPDVNSARLGLLITIVELNHPFFCISSLPSQSQTRISWLPSTFVKQLHTINYTYSGCFRDKQAISNKSCTQSALYIWRFYNHGLNVPWIKNVLENFESILSMCILHIFFSCLCSIDITSTIYILMFIISQ